MEKITIFTDGASRRNPGPGGWGAVVVANNRVTELGGGEAHTTNNRMELQAVIKAISFLVEYELISLSFKCTVYTDSSYVLNGITKWVHDWKERGWLTLKKEEVLNRDLWEQAAYLLDDMPGDEFIKWKLLSGHVGVAGNERCDVIATAFADGKKIDLYDGPLQNYTIDILNIAHDADKKAERSKSKSRSSQKAYSYISLVNGKIEVHKTWAECESRVKGVPNVKFKKSLDANDEATIIKSFLGQK